MNPIALAPTSLSNAEPLEFIDAAASAGYDGIGLRVFRSPGINYAFHAIAGEPQMETDVKAALSTYGLKVYDVLSFYMQPEVDFESMKEPLRFGAEIGADYALVIGDDPDWDRMVKNFATFCDLAGSYGLKASIEAPVTQRVVNKLQMAVDLVEQSGKDNAVVCLDPFHFFRTGHTPDDLKRYDIKLFPYTQLDDGLDNVPAPAGVVPPARASCP